MRIEVDDVTTDAILTYQAQHSIRSRARALAELVSLGSALDVAERGGFDLAPVLKRQLEDSLAALERRQATN
jgi:hypothetical protein